MPIDQASTQALFLKGDTFSSPKKEIVWQITNISEDAIHFSAISDATEDGSITYQALATALEQLPNEALNHAALPCLAATYQERLETLRYEEAVDAMWRTAGACQL